MTEPRKKAKSAKSAKAAKPEPKDKRATPPHVVAKYAQRARRK